MNDSESYRRECEARTVLAMPDRTRAEFLKAVSGRRGDPSVAALADEMHRLVGAEAKALLALPLQGRRDALATLERKGCYLTAAEIKAELTRLFAAQKRAGM